MKAFNLCGFIFWLCSTVSAQFTDDFSDGNFTNNPSWQGETIVFEVLNSELHLNAPAVSDQSYLSTSSQAMDQAVWLFDVRLEFNPSASNYLDIYLSSDTSNLEAVNNGYFVRIGNTLDEVSLYKTINGIESKIIDGTDDFTDTSEVNLRIKSTRDQNGNWEIQAAKLPSTNFISMGTILDLGTGTSDFFGFLCTYTSTRSDKFYIDNISITGNPGTVSTGSTTFGDLRFTEVMADPSPSAGLPEVEYLEIKNTTTDTLVLSSFSLVNTNTTKPIPTVIIPPEHHIILTDLDDVSNFNLTGTVVGIDGFSTLANSQDSLTLLNEAGAIIDILVYKDDWHINSTKKDGGWSLELINPNLACRSATAWTSSVNGQGGTPTEINSVNDILYTPPLTNLYQTQVINAAHLRLSFSDIISYQGGNSSLENSAQSIVIDSILTSPQTIDVYLEDSIILGEVYFLSLEGFLDCASLPLNLNDIPIAIPDQASTGDIIINEILFNPRNGGIDFVELYNRSDKNIDVGSLKLANIENDLIANQEIISNSGTLTLLAKNYIAISTNNLITLEQYPNALTQNLWEINDMPSYATSEGSVLLLNPSNDVLDRLDYTEEMHFALLNDFNGVSLERIFFDAPTQDLENWHSASEVEGFATPGYKNSQALDGQNSATGPFALNLSVFSPDGDGLDDQLILDYTLNQQGYVANIQIFDIKGREVRNLVNNQLLGTEGFFTWDGLSDNKSSRIPSGLYIIYAQLFNLDGSVKGYKLPVAVTYK